MRKLLLLALFGLLTAKGVAQGQPPQQVGEPIVFSVLSGPYTPIGGHTPVPRSPIPEPEISIDGYTLYTQSMTFDAHLVIIDQDGEEAFATFITVGTQSVALPSTLSGEYEILVIPNNANYYFGGYIML